MINVMRTAQGWRSAVGTSKIYNIEVVNALAFAHQRLADPGIVWQLPADDPTVTS
jgi:hypothetical protein